jgi:hypothetical protein
VVALKKVSPRNEEPAKAFTPPQVLTVNKFTPSLSEFLLQSHFLKFPSINPGNTI